MSTREYSILCAFFTLIVFGATASAQTCTIPSALSPVASQVVPPAGGPWSAQISSSASGCRWSLTADVPWITFVTPTSGTFPGRQTLFNFATVGANNGPGPLHGTITFSVGGVIIQRYPIVVTSNSCSYSVSPPSVQLGQEGGSGQFTLTATPSDCLPFDPNSALESVSLTTSTSATYDHGIFYYGIPPNSGAAISATATLSTQPRATFTVTQAGGDGLLHAGCPVSNAARVGGTLPMQCSAVGGTAPYTWSLVSGAYPAGTSTNISPKFFLSGNLTTEGPYSFTLQVTDSSSPPQTTTVNVSGVVLPAPVAMTCSTYHGPQQLGGFYFSSCDPRGGTQPYQWAISTGTLPSGLNMSPGPAGGVIISGVPTDPSPYYYVLQVSDTSQPIPLSARTAFSGIASSTLPVVSISCTSPTGPMYTSQNITLNQIVCNPSGGLGSYQFSISSGSLPPGLTLSGTNGVPLYLSGVLTTPGEFKFTIQVADSAVPPQTAQQTFDIVVIPGVTLTCTPSDGPTRVGQPYSSTCTAAGGQPPYVLSAEGLPFGINFTQSSPTTGTISGTPTIATNYYGYFVSATDSARNRSNVQFSGRLDAATGPPGLRLTCNPSIPPGWEVGVTITPVQCVATGGFPPYSWNALNGLNGLSLTAVGGSATVSGTPTTSSPFYGLSVADSSAPQPQYAQWTQGGTVSPRLTMNCIPSDSPTSVGQVFSSSCSSSGGVQPYSWSSSGNLPSGLTFNWSTFGLATAGISGSPTAPGPYNFTVTLQDSASSPVMVSQTFSGNILAVGSGVFVECSSTNGNYTGGSAITPVTCKASGGSPPYQWSISSGALPTGLTLTPVSTGTTVAGIPTVAGKFTSSVSATDSVGQMGSWPFSAAVANPGYPPGPFVSILSHLPFGNGWESRMVLTGLNAADSARMYFFDDAGNPIGVPYQQAATGTTSTSSFFVKSMSPYSVVSLDTTADASAPLTTGSAQLSSLSNQVAGYGVFRYPSRNWEALVPIDGVRDNSYTVTFDNTGSLWTGVALATADSNPVSVPVVVYDDSGSLLDSANLTLPPNGHTAFTVTEQFPSTAGKRGTITMTTTSYGSIRALAVRGNGNGVTTLPVLPAHAQGGGSIAHVTFNGGYLSTFVLVNTGTTATSFTLNFFDEAGGALNIPLLLPQTGTTLTTNALTRQLAAGATLLVQTQSDDSVPVSVGTAELTNGAVSGFEIFRWTTYAQEASVPFQPPTSFPRRLVFDNTGGFNTGVAVSLPTNLAGDIAVSIHDENGNLLQTSTISLQAHGHTAFMLPDRFPVTSGIRGSIEFGNAAGVIGLRVGPNRTLTTIPAL